MGKNTQGGKKHKKGKNIDTTEKPLELAIEGEAYASVTQLLGHGRIYCNVYTHETISNSSSFRATQRLGIIRGAMRKKKQWVKNGDVILVSVRDYEKDKVDVLHVYSDDHKLKLIKKQKIPNIDFNNNDKKSENAFAFENDSDSDKDDFTFEKKETSNNKEKGCTITTQSYIPESNLDEDSDIDNI